VKLPGDGAGHETHKSHATTMTNLPHQLIRLFNGKFIGNLRITVGHEPGPALELFGAEYDRPVGCRGSWPVWRARTVTDQFTLSVLPVGHPNTSSPE
jgi:hypothetical protein